MFCLANKDNHHPYVHDLIMWHTAMWSSFLHLGLLLLSLLDKNDDQRTMTMKMRDGNVICKVLCSTSPLPLPTLSMLHIQRSKILSFLAPNNPNIEEGDHNHSSPSPPHITKQNAYQHTMEWWHCWTHMMWATLKIKTLPLDIFIFLASTMWT